jgi:N utilization substance protein B
LQVLYAYYKSDQNDINKSVKELQFSINKAYELYFYILLLLVDIVLYAESRIEIARNKKVPSYQDLHPNTRFTDNRLLLQLRNNKQLLRFIETNHISWVNFPELIKELFMDISGSELYTAYMEAETCEYECDKKFITSALNHIILPNESLCQILEEKSIYWNDDLEFVISMVTKTIKQFEEKDGDEKELFELYKNDEDRDFVVDLLKKALLKRELSLELIKEKASNWDLERIAFMDQLIMQLAITEMIEFTSIPTKVTLNEYLDIAKFYSTEKSNTFINGVLDKIMQKLKEEKIIRKTGRGLIGEL